MFVATFSSLFAVLISGYLYDLFGRKVLLVIYFVIISISVYLFPRTAPNVGFLVAIRSLLQLLGASCLSNPLINDYVKKESRGKALALAAFGVACGEAFGMAVLFGYSKQMEMKQAFFTTSIVVLAMTLPFLCIVKEPVLK